MIYYVGNNVFPYDCAENATMEDVISFLQSKTEFAIDIETSRKYKRGQYSEDVYQAGLDPYLSRIVMLQVGDLQNRFVIDTRVIDITPLKPLLEGPAVKVGWNLKFEAKHLKNYGIELKNIYDGMLAEIMENNGKYIGYSLLEAAKRHLGVKDIQDVNLFSSDKYNEDTEGEEIFDSVEKTYVDKSIRLGFINIGDRPFTEEQIKYGADDITFPLLIKEKQNPPETLVKLENEFCLVLADIEYRGMDFDGKAWMDIYEQESRPKYFDSETWLDNFVVTHFPDFTHSFDLFSNKPTCAIQWTSSGQVVKLFRKLGICPKERSKSTGKQEWTVGAKALQKVLNEGSEYDELISKYLEFKEAEQACTTFGKDFLKYIHPITKRVHSSYRQILHTYRISSTNPNLQNVPRGTHRKAFVAPKGYKIVNADFNSQEVNVLANKSGDEHMIDMLSSGADPHCYTATKMFRIKLNDPYLEVSKESSGKGVNGKKDPLFKPEHATMRQSAKTVSFAIPYGASEHSLKDQLGTDEDTAKEFIDLYYKSYPGVAAYFEKVRKEDFKCGCITIDDKTNAKYYFPEYEEMMAAREAVYDLYPDNFKSLPKDKQGQIKEEFREEAKPHWRTFFAYKNKLGRRSQNFRIQGTSALITKLAAILIHRESKIITNLVHDEINACVPEHQAKWAKDLIEDKMKEAASYWCKLAPLGAEAQIVDYWTHSL